MQSGGDVRPTGELMLSVKSFGAAGDGATDDTAAIQEAIDAAGSAGGGGVWFHPGTYVSSRLQLRSYVSLAGAANWSYRDAGSTVIRLHDAEGSCLLDLTGAIGARVSGLSLFGANLGAGVAGVSIDGEGHETEDTIVVENTRVAAFSGDGITLRNIWAYTVRDSMMYCNGANGLTIHHWDGWVYNNIFISNGGYGIAALAPNAAGTITANRIEWNHEGGICIDRGSHYSLNSNYLDRSGGPAIRITGTDDYRPGVFAITGNVINRSGARAEPESHDSCHVYLEYVDGLVLTGNTMMVGTDDGGGGRLSPAHGIVYGGLRDSIIRDNVMHKGATRQLMVDLGGHDEVSIVKDNVGSLAPARAGDGANSEHTD